MGSDIGIREIAEQHRARNRRWHTGAQPWTKADWSNALAGEVGEICNKIKKIRRIELGHTGNQLRNQSANIDAIIADIRGELGGAFIYMLALADALDVDLADAIRDEFNLVSEQQGFPERIPGAAS